MKNLISYLKESFSGYLDYNQADDYLNKIKGKELSFEELKNGIKKECYLDEVEYEEDDNLVTVYYNPYNNAEGPDVLLTIKLEKDSSKEKLKVKNWEYEEI